MSKTHSDAEDKVLLRHNARDMAWLTLNRPKAYNALFQRPYVRTYQFIEFDSK